MTWGVRARRVLLPVVALGLGAAAPAARAQDNEDAAAPPDGAIRVEVVDVADGRAYLTPGAGAGVDVGVVVRIGDRAAPVVAATDGFAVVAWPSPLPAVGDAGSAVPRVAEDREVPEPLAEPRPLRAFAHQWRPPRPPAEGVEVEPIGLGGGTLRGEALQLDLFLGGYAAVPLDPDAGPGIGMGTVRARLHAEPWSGVPLSVDVDAAARYWVAPDLDQRASGASRPHLVVRELALRYGDVDQLAVAAGRLRYAASLLGPVDGVRVRTPTVHGLTFGAFGGGVPDPRSGLPSFAASRFGLEARYENHDSVLRPFASLVVHGSLFEGRLDERRLAGEVQLFPGPGRAGAHFELSLHDPDNPWQVSALELSAAGVEGGVRVDDFDLSARFDLRRPERSRWLAANLPPGYLCAIDQAQHASSGACLGGDDARYLGSLDLGQRVGEAVQLRGGGQVIHYPVDPTLSQAGGYAEVALATPRGAARGSVRGEAWTSTLVARYGGRVGVGWAALPDALDLSARYRLFHQRYRAELSPSLEHAVGLGLLWTPRPTLDLTVDADLFTGRDADLVLVQAQAAWRY